MKKKEKNQIMQKKPTELIKLISQKREEIAHATLKRSEEKDTNLVKKLKKELAVMLTSQREQEILSRLQTGGGHT